MRMKFAIVYGSVRQARQGIRAAKFIQKQIEKRGHETTLIDPAEYDLPLLNKMYKEYEKGQAPKELELLSKIFNEADAIIPITAEYNHLPPPALTNLLDHFMEEYSFKPSAIVCYSAGNFGGIRASSHMRDFLCELGMPSIPSEFAISKIQESIDTKGNAADKAYDRRIKKFLDELEWYAKALKNARKKGTPY